MIFLERTGFVTRDPHLGSVLAPVRGAPHVR